MKTLNSLLAAGLLVAAPVYADCLRPSPPEVLPDGSTAAKAEMIAAQKLLRAYNDEVKAYTDCLRLEHDSALAAAGDQVTAETRKQLDRQQAEKNDSAVDQAEAVTTRFNEQIRKFNAKNQSKKG